MLENSVVYNDGARMKVISTKADGMLVSMITARQLVGYEGVETRTPRRRRRKGKKNLLDNELGVEGKVSIDTSGIHNSAREAMIKWMSKNELFKTTSTHKDKRMKKAVKDKRMKKAVKNR
jgi:hypothetical protein